MKNSSINSRRIIKKPSKPKRWYKIISSTFHFNCNITELFRIISNQAYSNEFLSNSYCNFLEYSQIYLDELRPYSKISQFFTYCKSTNSLINYKIKQILETDYHCYIHFIGREIETGSVCVFCVFNFHYESENRTLFLSTYYLPWNYSEEWSFEEARVNYYIYIDKFISNRDYLRVNVDSRKVIGSLSAAKHVISNLKMLFSTFSTVNKVNIDWENDEANISSVVNSNDILGYNLRIYAEVKETTVTDNYISVYLILKATDNKLDDRLTEVRVEKSMEDNTWLLINTHHYKIELEEKQYKYVTYYKKQFLGRVAKLIEYMDKKMKLKLKES